MDEFRKKILKVNGPRNHKIRNSIGVYQMYKFIRKNKWMDIGKPVSEHDFYSIIRILKMSIIEKKCIEKCIFEKNNCIFL